MINRIKLRKGLDIALQGVAVEQTSKLPVAGIYAISPDDFPGFKPKVTVAEGDEIKVGDPLFVNKDNPALKVVSPVSGKVSLVNRGERRKVINIQVEADGNQTSRDFSVDTSSAESIKALLLESGLFAFIKQRPFDITASAEDSPKAIFISTFSKMPLAADFSYVIKGQEKDFSKGIETLAKIAPVNVGIAPQQESLFTEIEKFAQVTIFDGPCPSSNVGIQINHISPINKGEIVWTLGAEEVIFIGRLVNTSKVDLTRTIALAGSKVATPQYFTTPIGTSLSALSENIPSKEHVRIINGNPLVGTVTTTDGFLASHATEVCAIPEGDDKDEILGWIMPRFKDFSVSRSYFSWLQRGKKYDLDARVKGGERHIIMSGEYDKVLPMDIYAGYLIKAIIAKDLDRMEQLGILEVSPEDFAVAEFVDSSKLELQRIVREGLDLYRKEML